MDSKQYAPGAVAAITTNERRGEARAVRRSDVWHFLDIEGYAIDPYVTDIRPLVALEPALGGNWTPNGLREGARRCRDADSEFGVGNVAALLDRLADQIEQQTRPPKPPEPTGLGAVVEADFETDAGKGYGPATWSLAGDGSWVCLTDGLVGTKAPWPFLTNVKVLSEGVTQ